MEIARIIKIKQQHFGKLSKIDAILSYQTSRSSLYLLSLNISSNYSIAMVQMNEPWPMVFMIGLFTLDPFANILFSIKLIIQQQGAITIIG